MGFLESLVGNIMSFCFAAQLDKLVSHEPRLGHWRQHADGGFTAFEFLADLLAAPSVNSEALVMKRAQEATADQEYVEKADTHAMTEAAEQKSTEQTAEHESADCAHEAPERARARRHPNCRT